MKEFYELLESYDNEEIHSDDLIHFLERGLKDDTNSI